MRLINVNDESFIYGGELCKIDTTVPRGGKVVSVFNIKTNAKFSLPAKTDVKVIVEEEIVEEEIIEAEIIEESEEENEDQSDWLEDTTEEV